MTSSLQSDAAVSAWTWPHRFEIIPYRTIGSDPAKLLCSDVSLRLGLGGSHVHPCKETSEAPIKQTHIDAKTA